MGAIKSMKAVAEIPSGKRTKGQNKLIANGCEYFLKHHVHYRSRKPEKVAKPIWEKFGFPLFYQTDALDMLLLLTKLGCNDERMQKAVDLVLSKQNKQGKWILERSFKYRMIVPVEKEGKNSKWITLNALRVLKSYYS